MTQVRVQAPASPTTVRWWRVVAVWPLTFALSVAGTVLASLLVTVARTGEVGAPSDARYVALWVAILAVGPAVLVGAPLLAFVAVVLRAASLGWQVLTVAWAAAWLAGGTAMYLQTPWGPFRWMTADPTAPYPWADVAPVVGIAAIAWASGVGAAWAVVRPVRASI